jgi:hypothetical protein
MEVIFFSWAFLEEMDAGSSLYTRPPNISVGFQNDQGKVARRK